MNTSARHLLRKLWFAPECFNVSPSTFQESGYNMSRYKGITHFSHGNMDSLGILVCNLGSPDAPTPQALRRYLAEFLWDPRVIEVSRPLWWMILHGIILRTRPAKSAEAYKSVWTEAGPPLIDISQRQTTALQTMLETLIPGPVTVALAMRYGKPSIAQGLAQLQAAHCRRVLVLPLYPQYSGATTASIFDAVVDELKGWRWLPELRFVNHYHDDTGYINALAASVREKLQGMDDPDCILFSFHGTPKRYFDNGDPYFCECQKTARLTADALGLTDTQWRVTFQSRFGREEWLKPYTDKTLEHLPKEGIKRVAVVCPGFAADCLETLEEIEVENREYFMNAGGEQFTYIPALNDRADHIEGLAQLVLKHVQGWPEAQADWNASHMAHELEQRQHRATAMGAKQ